jgi:hypothetical protein
MTISPPSQEHTIEELCKRSHMISVEKGWATNEGDPRSFATITALNHSELSEALEEWRNNKPVDEIYYEVTIKDQPDVPSVVLSQENWKPARETGRYNGKPCGIPIELADFIIRIAQHVGTAHTIQELMHAYRDESHLAMPLIFDIYLADAHSATSKAYDATKTGQSSMKFHWLAASIKMTFGFCERSGIDLWAAIDEKEAYNRTRPHKHGGKKV